MLSIELLIAKYFANFNDGFGMWSNVKSANDPLDWRRGRGKTSSNSGPDGDHTDGRGEYCMNSINFCLVHCNDGRVVIMNSSRKSRCIIVIVFVLSSSSLDRPHRCRETCLDIVIFCHLLNIYSVFIY